MRLESTVMPDIGNPADALQESVLYKAYTTAFKTYSEKMTGVENLVPSFDNEASLKASFDVVTQHTLQTFRQHGHEQKYGSTHIWRKYQEYLLQKFEEDLRALLNQFVAQRKIEALAEQNRREREAAEKTFRQNQKKMEKLEQETIRVTNRLAESSRLAEQREKINRDHVQTLTNQMNNARAEFRQIYEGRLQAQEQRIAEERQQKEQALQEYEAQLEESRRQQEALQNRMARQEQENEDRQREMNRELKEIRDKANERKWWQFWKYF